MKNTAGFPRWNQSHWKMSLPSNIGSGPKLNYLIWYRGNGCHGLWVINMALYSLQRTVSPVNRLFLRLELLYSCQYVVSDTIRSYLEKVGRRQPTLIAVACYGTNTFLADHEDFHFTSIQVTYTVFQMAENLQRPKQSPSLKMFTA